MDMSQLVSKWPVVLELPLEDPDVVGERLTEAAALRMFTEARAAYLALPQTLESFETGEAEVRSGTARMNGDVVTISAGVNEIFEQRFIVMGRIRPAEGEEIVADLRCSVSVPGGVTKELRDELIAIAHGAQHFHLSQLR